MFIWCLMCTRCVLWWSSLCPTQRTTLFSSGTSPIPSMSVLRFNSLRSWPKCVVFRKKSLLCSFPSFNLDHQLELEHAKTEDCTIEYSTGTFTCLAAVFKMRRNPGKIKESCAGIEVGIEEFDPSDIFGMCQGIFSFLPTSLLSWLLSCPGSGEMWNVNVKWIYDAFDQIEMRFEWIFYAQFLDPSWGDTCQSDSWGHFSPNFDNPGWTLK